MVSIQNSSGRIFVLEMLEVEGAHRIDVWYIYLHLALIYGKLVGGFNPFEKC